MSGLLGYLLYRVLSGLFGLLPAPAMRSAGRGIGFGLSFVDEDLKYVLTKTPLP